LPSKLRSKLINKLNPSFARIPFLDVNCAPNYSGCPYVLSAICVSATLAEFLLLLLQYKIFPEFMGAELTN
jgi:hypothetical protein